MYIPDYQHLVTAINPGECDCIPEPVWERESGGNRRGRHCGDGGEYVGGGGVLQGDG